jgi:hypothetical protein
LESEIQWKKYCDKISIPHATTFCGLYFCVAEMDGPASIANGSRTNATEKKSIVDLVEIKFHIFRGQNEKELLQW